MNVLEANTNLNRTDLLSDKVKAFHNFKGQMKLKRFMNYLECLFHKYLHLTE